MGTSEDTILAQKMSELVAIKMANAHDYDSGSEIPMANLRREISALVNKAILEVKTPAEVYQVVGAYIKASEVTGFKQSAGAFELSSNLNRLAETQMLRLKPISLDGYKGDPEATLGKAIEGLATHANKGADAFATTSREELWGSIRDRISKAETPAEVNQVIGAYAMHGEKKLGQTIEASNVGSWLTKLAKLADTRITELASVNEGDHEVTHSEASARGVGHRVPELGRRLR